MAWTQTATIGMGNPERERIISNRARSISGKGGGWATKTAGQPSSAPTTPTATTSGTPSDVSGAFQSALDTLSSSNADAEKVYQQGRRQAMSQGAISAINAGAANTVNMPAMGIAYDQAVRPAYEVGLAAQKAGVYQNLGQTAANIYGTNVGAQTQRYTADVGAATAASGQGLQFATNQANQSLQRYIAQLNAQATQSANTSPISTNILGAPRAA